MKKLSVLLLSMFVLAACSSDPKTTDSGSTAAASESAESTAELPVQELTIVASGNTMDVIKYNITEIRAAAGQTLKITLKNESTDEAMHHNIVFIKEGTNETVGIAGLQAGPDNDYIPSSDDVIAGSKMLAPGESTVFEFTAPSTPGNYEYVCTYPGHFTLMRGVFIVE